MVPSYDFDIHWLIPREVEADPAIGKRLGDIGINTNARGNYVALFRDPQVVAMIERADPVLRAFLKASGFGFTTYQSGAPAGFYPAGDDGAHVDVIARLDENLKNFDLKGADLGGFDFGLFLKAIVEARPMPASTPVREPHPATRAPAAADVLDVLAAPSGEAKLFARNRVMPVMMLSLAAMMGVYWLIEHVRAAAIGF